jgi:hypothetical protein
MTDVSARNDQKFNETALRNMPRLNGTAAPGSEAPRSGLCCNWLTRREGAGIKAATISPCRPASQLPVVAIGVIYVSRTAALCYESRYREDSRE